MRVLVTGAGGTVAAALEDPRLVKLGRADLDVTDAEAVRRKVECKQAIIHLAAATDVDRCESDRDWAHRLNAEAAEHVARAALEHGAYLIHVSTTAIFGGDGAPGPFSEDDLPAPPNWYAETKLEGERRVQAILQDACVVRTAWVMGGGHADKKFVGKVAARLLADQPIRATDDERGSPTYALDLAAVLLRLLDLRPAGVLHVTNTGDASRYEMALEMKRILGSRSEIEPVPAATFPLLARRSPSDASISRRLPSLGITLSTWQDALARYLATFARG